MSTFIWPVELNNKFVVSALRTTLENPFRLLVGDFHYALIISKDGRIRTSSPVRSYSSPLWLKLPPTYSWRLHRVLYVIFSRRLGKPGQTTTKWLSLPRSGVFSTQDVATRTIKHQLMVRTHAKLFLRSKRTGPFRSKSSARPNPEVVTASLPTFSWDSSNGATGSGSSTFEIYRRTWSGTTTPNFGKLKAKRMLLPVNDHAVSIVQTEMGEYVRRETEGVFQFNPTPFSTLAYSPMNIRYSFDALPSHDVSADNVALRRLFDKSESQLSGNLAQDFAQFGQLFNLIGGTALRLSGALNDLRRKNFSGAVKSLWSSKSPRYRRRSGPNFTSDLANNWLELQYGWKPLLQDIHDSMDALARYNVASAYIRQVSGSCTKTTETSVNVNLFEYGSIVGGRKITSNTSTSRFKIRYKIDDHLKSFLAQTGFTNPLALGWEILPFSFVVDWFLPIGNYLQTISAWDGLQFVDGVQTRFTRNRQTVAISYSGPATAPPSEPYTFMANGSMTRDVVLLNRTRLTSFPSGRFPTFKNPLSTIHALNGLALLKQTFIRRG